MRLSTTQRHALQLLADLGALDDFTAVIHVGPSRARTLAALERRGLARWAPYARRGKGAWRLTAEGRAAARTPEEPAHA